MEYSKGVWVDLKSTKNACVVMCLLLAGTAQLHAQTGSAGQGGEFLRYGVGARALAMGRAFTALANDASAVYWNPAGLGTLNQWQLAAMHSRLFADSRYQYLAVAGPLFSSNNSRLTHHFGAGIINLASDNFDERNSFNVSTGTFGTQDFAVLLPYALNIVNSWGSLNLGIKPQFFSQEVRNASGSGFGVDVGFLWQPLSPPALGFIPLKSLMAWRLGVNYRALSSVKLITLEQDYPNSLNIGISNVAFEDVVEWLVPGDRISNWPVKMVIALEYEKTMQSRRDSEFHFGTEITARVGRSFVAAARYGYRFGRTDFEDKVSFGFGIKADGVLWQDTPLVAGLRGLSLDFANASHPQLGNSYQLFLTASISDWRRDVMRHRKVTTLQGSKLTMSGVTAANIGSVTPSSDSLAAFDSLSVPQLLALLGEYSSDDRVVTDRDVFDGRYKDEVARALSVSAERDSNVFLRERYDEFILGLPLLYKLANLEFRRIRAYHSTIGVGSHAVDMTEKEQNRCGLRRDYLMFLTTNYETLWTELVKERNRKYLLQLCPSVDSFR